ncbi:zf-RVT domain-containing protein, partial [Cephalotus follicularis]
TFSCKEAWQGMRQILPKVAWADIVWFLDCIPKHSFCLWLTFHNAHRTMDKLRSYGLVADNQCLFGCCGLESIDHLFFGCEFTAGVWNLCLRKFGFRRGCRPWMEGAAWVTDKLRGRSFKGWISRVALAAVVYFCWTERNNRVFRNEYRDITDIQNLIGLTVLSKCQGMKMFPDSLVNRDISGNWGIPERLLVV